MSDVTVGQFADVLKISVEALIKQLDEAGLGKFGPGDIVGDDAKRTLLTHLRRVHGHDRSVASPSAIRNCRFAYKCDKRWDSLQQTSQSAVRFCDECQREVHWCSTKAELVKNVALNRCIAIEVTDFIGPRRVLMGLPAPKKR